MLRTGQCHIEGWNFRRSHRNRNWCGGCRRRKSEICLFQSTHSPISSISCCVIRHIHRYVQIPRPAISGPGLDSGVPKPSKPTEFDLDRMLTTSPAVIAADRASAAYDIEHTPQKKLAQEREREREAVYEAERTALQRAKDWASENRYPILFGVWVASMAGSWSLVNRNRYLSGSQKLVQARMYAQGATLSALLASFAFEGTDAAKGRGRWETIKVLDPNDPEHKHMIEKKVHHENYPGEDQWREMIEAEEERIKERDAKKKAREESQSAKAKEHEKEEDAAGKESAKKEKEASK